MHLFCKILDAVTNSVDPDQTILGEHSNLCLHCLHIPSTILVVGVGVQDVSY